MTTSLTCSARTFPTANGSLSSLRFFSSYGTASQTQTSQTKAPEECHQEQNWWSGPWGRSLRLNRICQILFFAAIPSVHIRSHSSFLPLSVSFYGADWGCLAGHDLYIGFPMSTLQLVEHKPKDVGRLQLPSTMGCLEKPQRHQTNGFSVKRKLFNIILEGSNQCGIMWV